MLVRETEFKSFTAWGQSHESATGKAYLTFCLSNEMHVADLATEIYNGDDAAQAIAYIR